MKQITVPMISGLITFVIHVLVVAPILFTWMFGGSFGKERALKKGKLEVSKMAEWMK